MESASQPAGKTERSWLRRVLPGIGAALLLALVWAVYSPAIHFDLLSWDDDINLQSNPHLTGISGESLIWMFTDLTYQQRYQPLAWLSWFAIYEVQGLDPFGYHLIVVLLHAANTLLVLLLARRFFPGRELLACLAAAVWSLHPMRVETVVWAVELLYQQALFFLLLSYLAYLKANDSGIDATWARYCRWASLAGFAYSLFTFPLAFGFVVVLVATDIYLLRRLPESYRTWSGEPARRIWLEKLPYVVLTLLAFWLNMVSRMSATTIFMAPVPLETFGIIPRVMQAFYVWAYYLWRPLWPVDLKTIPTALVEFDPFAPIFLLSVCLVIGGTWLVFRVRGRWPALWVVWLTHLALLVPVLGLSEHPHMTSDRYSLIVSIGWGFIVVALWERWQQGTRWRGVPEVIAATVLAVLMGLSAKQVPYWANNFSFFKEVATQLGGHPIRFTVLWRLGIAHYEAGQWNEGDKVFDEALKIHPGDVARRSWLAGQQAQRQEYARAWENCQILLAQNPRVSGVHYLMGMMLMEQGKNAEAAKEFAAELQVSPPDLALSMSLFITTARAGQMVEAQELYRAVIGRYQLTEEQYVQCILAIAEGHAVRGNLDKAIAIASPLPARARQAGQMGLAGEVAQRVREWENAREKAQPK